MKKTILAIMLTTGVCYSCSDSFLDVENPNELTSANFFKKVSHFDLALDGTYDAVKNLDLFGQNFYIQTLLALPHESDYWNAQNRNEVNSADGAVYIAWRGFYRIIARANDLIENAPLYSPANVTEIEQLDIIVAQAKFLRAFAYFHLVRLWGEESYAVDKDRLSVPLILKVATSREEMMVPRATVGAVYDQILADLKAAEEVLPDSWETPTNENIARVSKYAVKGFLGQVHLYRGEEAEARAYFEEIINNPSYQLVTSDRYDDLFQGKNEFSSESLWEISYTVDMAENIWENGLGSGIALVIAAPERGWSNCTPHGVNIDRFGSDPRLSICTYAPEDLLADANGAMKPAGVSPFNFTGHSFRKYNPKDYCVLTTNRNSGTNYMIMRLADVYLMYAEILNNAGEDADAAEYMNKIRRRAYGFNSNSPQPSVDYTVTGTQLRDSIREERFRELFGEGHRWYDIVRWKIVEEEVLKYNDKTVTQGVIVYQPKDYYYPVPLGEIDTNNKMTPSTDY